MGDYIPVAGNQTAEEGSREPRWYRNIFSYTRSSKRELEYFEDRLFSYIPVNCDKYYVHIDEDSEREKKIWTISINKDSPNIPLLLIHGMGAAVGLWLLNYEELSRDRPVYAIDMLGFGKSSRCKMQTDPVLCEKEYVESIEKWCRKMNLDEFVLMGHSMGGFLSSSYAISYPKRVKHLILVDPWGMEEARPISNLLGRIIQFIYKPFNPHATLRLVGPFGRRLSKKYCKNFVLKFDRIVKDKTLIPAYLHQCNARKPTGEDAFRAMSSNLKYAKNPMVKRLPNDLDSSIPISFYYGDKSFIYEFGHPAAIKIKRLRCDSEVTVETIRESGHSIYIDQPNEFNQRVNDVCFQYNN